MAEITYKDRILGSLIGFAIGDAMGATTEFMSREQITEKYGTVDKILGGGWLHLNPGQVTDDTEMMLVVYRAMRRTKGHPHSTLRTICQGFKDWLMTNPPDVGQACYKAIQGTQSCDPKEWIYHNRNRVEKTGIRPLGNGGLMRCLVPCLAGDLQLAQKQSYLTHSDDIHNIYIENYYELLQDALQGKKTQVLGWRMEPRGHVVNTFGCVQWWYIESRTFEEAIIGPVNDGGDADTIAALTGGLAGALYGVQAIPKDWINALDLNVLTELTQCADWLTQ